VGPGSPRSKCGIARDDLTIFNRTCSSPPSLGDRLDRTDLRHNQGAGTATRFGWHDLRFVGENLALLGLTMTLSQFTSLVPFS